MDLPDLTGIDAKMLEHILHEVAWATRKTPSPYVYNGRVHTASCAGDGDPLGVGEINVHLAKHSCCKDDPDIGAVRELYAAEAQLSHTMTALEGPAQSSTVCSELVQAAVRIANARHLLRSSRTPLAHQLGTFLDVVAKVHAEIIAAWPQLQPAHTWITTPDALWLRCQNPAIAQKLVRAPICAISDTALPGSLLGVEVSADHDLADDDITDVGLDDPALAVAAELAGRGRVTTVHLAGARAILA